MHTYQKITVIIAFVLQYIYDFTGGSGTDFGSAVHSFTVRARLAGGLTLKLKFLAASENINDRPPSGPSERARRRPAPPLTSSENAEVGEVIVIENEVI